jgi:hypothetical protein
MFSRTNILSFEVMVGDTVGVTQGITSTVPIALFGKKSIN